MDTRTVELTQFELDALSDALTLALDDQMECRDSGRMAGDYSRDDLMTKAASMGHLANVAMRLGLAYTSGMYSALAKDILDDAAEKV